MRIFDWLSRNSIRYTNTKWEDSEEGRRFYEKCLSAAEKRAMEREEWERTTPPEKKEQVKLFKIFFTFFLFLFAGLLIWGFKTGNEMWILLGEFIFSGASLALFFIKPKFVEYPNCFMMPVIAVGCVVLLYVYMGISFGFNPAARKNKTAGMERAEAEADCETCGVFLQFGESDFSDSTGNNFGAENETEEDFENHKNAG